MTNQYSWLTGKRTLFVIKKNFFPRHFQQIGQLDMRRDDGKGELKYIA